MSGTPSTPETAVARRFAELHRKRYYVGEACPCGCRQRYTCNNNCIRCAIFRSFLSKLFSKLPRER